MHLIKNFNYFGWIHGSHVKTNDARDASECKLIAKMIADHPFCEEGFQLFADSFGWCCLARLMSEAEKCTSFALA